MSSIFNKPNPPNLILISYKHSKYKIKYWIKNISLIKKDYYSYFSYNQFNYTLYSVKNIKLDYKIFFILKFIKLIVKSIFNNAIFVIT